MSKKRVAIPKQYYQRRKYNDKIIKILSAYHHKTGVVLKYVIVSPKRIAGRIVKKQMGRKCFRDKYIEMPSTKAILFDETIKEKL